MKLRRPARGVKGLATRIERGLAERTGYFDHLLGMPVVWAVVAVVGCTLLLLPRSGGNLPDWQPGEVATFDVVVPGDLSVPDAAATERVREEARASVLPVYDLEPRLELELAGEVRLLFAACRNVADNGEQVPVSELEVDPAFSRILESSECSEGLENALLDVLGQVYRTRVVDDLRAFERAAERGVVVRDLATGGEHIEAADGMSMSTPVDLRTGVEPAVRTRLLEHEAVARRWIKPATGFLEANLAANLVYSRAETAARVRSAVDQVTPRWQVFRRGQVLIRRGDTVSPSVAQTLRLINRQRQEVTRYSSIVGIGLLVTLIVVGLWRVVRRLDGTGAAGPRLSMLFLIMLLYVLMVRTGLYVAAAVAAASPGPVLSAVDAYVWGLPFAAGPASVFVLLGVQPAVLFALAMALMCGIMLGGDFAVFIFALAGGTVGALALQQFFDRAGFSRAGLVVGLNNLVVLLVLQLFKGLPELPETMAVAAAAAFVGGPVALGIASFLLPIMERAFGVTTDIRLLELSNQNLPLLKRLSLQAPGTFQHSLAVGNLVEVAADAVGANALLLRVCAYYHDIGKLVKPEYFVENQRGSNPHDNLSPSMSCLVIQSHVKEGLEMARQEKLPLAVRQAIATHHGTKLIRYFFDKARADAAPGGDANLERSFRYPGPKPHTKELGILLLADAVEAAARTLDNPTPSKIQGMIDRIFTDALDDGQLDDSALTLSDIDKVASAFLWVLTNMYHHRIDYPGFDFNRRRERREQGPLQVGAKTVATGG